MAVSESVDFVHLMRTLNYDYHSYRELPYSLHISPHPRLFMHTSVVLRPFKFCFKYL